MIEHPSYTYVDYLHGIHEQVKKTISDNNAKYMAWYDTHCRRVVFQVDDLIWAVITHDMFQVGEYTILKEKKIDPCKVL
jgi:hypothetical protein